MSTTDLVVKEYKDLVDVKIVYSFNLELQVKIFSGIRPLSITYVNSET